MRLPESRITDPMAQAFYHKGSSGTGVLLIHGFTGTAAHMRPLGDALAKAGHTVHGILLPGHGTSLPEMVETGWRDWLRAARSACLDLMGKCEKVIVCGLSMGGDIALILAAELPVAGVIAVSAPMEVQMAGMRLAWLVHGIYPYRPWHGGKKEKTQGMDNPYSIGYSGTPVKKVTDLVHLIDDARLNLSRIECPILIIQSRKDETVHPRSAEIISDGAENAVPRNILYLEESPHVCTIGPELPVIIRRVTEFVEEPLRG